MKSLRATQFHRFAKLVHEHSGIHLNDMKAELLRARLGKPMRALGLDRFEDYYERVTGDESGRELQVLLDCVSTNKTEFFREAKHFGHLAENAVPGFLRARRAEGEAFRAWSCACSSGEECYTIAMTALEALQGRSPLKVLGTDISGRMLERAQRARYSADQLAAVPDWMRRRHWEAAPSATGFFQPRNELRALVSFGRLNLNDAGYPFKKAFDVIFCRNVMIYFDRPTQEAVVEKLSRQLKPGGFLYTGLSESLIGIRHSLKVVAPSVYQRRN